MIRLKTLKRGSRIGIAAPAGPFDRRRFLTGVQNLRTAGFEVVYGRDIFSRADYLAGNDARRSRELNRLLQDPKIDAVLFARGGYGTQRLLPGLRKIHPKIVVGLSDLTVLLAALWKKFRLPTLYGPMVATQLIHLRTVRRLKKVLLNPKSLEGQTLMAKRVLHGGTARGRLVGGCLSLVASLLGTPYDIDTRGTILFLEDVDEPPYRIDRFLTQLEQAGKFSGVRGIILGTFRLKKELFPTSIRKVVEERLKSFKGPILWGIHFGHCPNPQLIPFGGIGLIQGNRLQIERGIFDAKI